jgi:DNA-binding transcriptional MerR regulator
MSEGLLRIGQVAARLGLSTRTLRYYEELGLLEPTGHTAGGARRYTELDVERVAHIRRLQQVMGFDLDRIRDFLRAEDELARLRAEYSAGPPPDRGRQIATEALTLYDRMRAQVQDKLDALAAFDAEIEEKAARAARVARGERPAPERTGRGN